MRRPRVAVVGPATDAPPDVLAAAYDVGKLLAEAGVLVLTGGLGGVMAEACRGAADGGGASAGLLPGTDPAAANEWVTIPVATGLGEGRNLLVVRAADAVIAVGGSWGTLSEVALAVRTGVPVCSLHGWSVSDGRGHVPAGSPRPVERAAEAVEWVLARVGGR